MTTVLPTHTCFDDALDLLVDILKSNPDIAKGNEVKLVHGICLMPNGEEYAHAWLESLEKTCIFVGIVDGKREYLGLEIDEFYKSFKVQETTKYTPIEAWQENYNHATYGPWVKKYKELCR